MARYPIQGSNPISKYYENFKQYISEAGILITRMLARVIFLGGLTEKNKLYLFWVGSSPSIENLVKILEETQPAFCMYNENLINNIWRYV